ncbi:NAD(P)-binding protein [Pseudonocardia sp.]|uniref:NAD(P)-binding protein n=1 Tax=Pseudonocardia sp. TaxID=60912 RepID=UPI0026200DD1|nr:NAD(P)-binding protein [Pseudonocardia sp.]
MSTSRNGIQVLVVGAGYAGATLAVRLAGRSRGRVAVAVVDAETGGCCSRTAAIGARPYRGRWSGPPTWPG